jgi:acetyltransferase-like isoleucine patch superfamily enzyme
MSFLSHPIFINPLTVYGRYVVNAIVNKLKSKGYRQGYGSIALKCQFDENVRLFKYVEIHRSNVGRYSYISDRSLVIECDIGAFCSIASDCYLGMPVHSTEKLGTHPIFFSNFVPAGKAIYKKPLIEEFPRTKIGNDVWIGAKAMIRGGVEISDGAIIAAGAVVTKNVNPYEIVGGVPAKVIRKRFSDDKIINLLAEQWWNLPIEQIEKRILENKI